MSDLSVTVNKPQSRDFTGREIVYFWTVVFTSTEPFGKFYSIDLSSNIIYLYIYEYHDTHGGFKNCGICKTIIQSYNLRIHQMVGPILNYHICMVTLER